MKTVFYSGLLLCLAMAAGCGQGGAGKAKAADVTDSKPSAYSKLAPLFKDIQSDSLYVYSTDDLANKSYKFLGTKLDSQQVALLPADVRGNYDPGMEFAACFKLPIDVSKMGLIVRVPGMYVSSALRLLVFDLEKDSVVKLLDLSDLWGDAGESSDYSSYLFKDKDNRLLQLCYAWSAYDHTVSGVEGDTLVESWRNYSLCSLSGDTLSKDSAEIAGRYPAIVKQMKH